MKIGVFDSGLGGALIMQSIRKTLPDHDLVYLGDTLHMPYGGRSKEAIYRYTKNAMDTLFKAYDCALIIIACNTASAAALRRLQQAYLAENYPERRILGVVIPTLEETLSQNHTNIGLIATENIINSRVYEEELLKINPEIKLHTMPTPLLVPLIEHEGYQWIEDVLSNYLQPLLAHDIEALILGCTHYAFLRPYLKDILPHHVKIIAQDDIIPKKLKNYLERHPEISCKLTICSTTQALVTDLTSGYKSTLQQICPTNLDLKHISIPDSPPDSPSLKLIEKQS